MIAPMKKIFLVVPEAARRASLSALGRLGVVHVETVEGQGAAFEAAASRLAQAERALGILDSYAPPKKAAPLDLDFEAADKAFAETVAAFEAIGQAHGELATLGRELERVAPWGEVDPGLAASLAGEGLALRFVEGPLAQADHLPAELSAIRLASPRGKVRFCLVNAPATLVLPGEFRDFVLPAVSPGELRLKADALRASILDREATLRKLARARPSLRRRLVALRSDLVFENLGSGMGLDGPLAYLSGFVPEAQVPDLKDFAAREALGLLIDDPRDEDLPPSKVENGPLVRIIQPVFDFLGTVPNYREYDISAPFLFFFSFFFAMIFGDAGYGSVLLLVGLGLALRSKLAGKTVPDPIRLFILLAASTVAWGALSGSWFGLPLEKLPAFTGWLDLYFVSSANPASGDNVKLLCFALGTVQLVLAHLKNIRRDLGSLKFLAQVGQLAMVVGMLFLVLNLVISASRFPIPSWSMALIGGGFGLSFIFGNYEAGSGFLRGVLRSILGSLANIVSVFLGVVNVFADIVSYIRLWAVGLAGLAISETVNNMAGPLLGHLILFAVGGLLLVFGHGLNVIMSVLSVVVHGVRLNMLEFSSHLGMEWSGHKYEPFTARAPEDRQ